MKTNIVGENIGAKMKHNAIVALLDEYAGCYRVVDSCRQEEKYGKPCLTCLADINRMQEIIKELEASIRKDAYKEGWDNAIEQNYQAITDGIRKEVVSELYNYMETEGGRDLVKAYAEFNRIENNMKQLIKPTLVLIAIASPFVVLLGLYLFFGFMDWIAGDPWNLINNLDIN